MASFSEWLRGLGNAGAVTNAAQACRDRHLAERRTDVVLHRLASALAAAARGGARTVDLTSRPSREAANRLYQRLGFTLRDTTVYRFDLDRMDPFAGPPDEQRRVSE